jgi:hypothetical protein
VLRAGYDSLDYPLVQLAAIGFAFEILEPAEFRQRAAELAGRLAAAAGTKTAAAPPA